MLDKEFEKRIKVTDTPEFGDSELLKKEKFSKKAEQKGNSPKTSHPNGAFELEDILLRQEERGLI